MSTEIIRTLRSMAWSRAKGELHSMLHTFWPQTASPEQYTKMADAIKVFIKEIEDNALHE